MPLTAASVPPVVEIQGLCFRYPVMERRSMVLDEVDLTIRERQFLGIVGPNAGGKSTLLKVILGLLQPQRGVVRVFGAPPRKVRHRIGYVPQHPSVDPSVPATALDIVLMGRLKRASWGPIFRAADRQAARTAMARTGTEQLCDRPIASLSGGQRQRVMIARALAAEAEMLLLDEPTTGIDPRHEEELFELLRELNARMTIVLVTHDISFALAHAHSVVSVDRRISSLEGREVSPGMLAEIYGGEFTRLDGPVEP